MVDRPGALATLARSCGEQGVNILALQIFPGLEGVVDELVLRVPEAWGAEEVRVLVAGAGGDQVTAAPCDDHALVDGPVHYLHALRRVVRDPTATAEVLAQLLGADPVAPDDADLLTVEVGAHRVELRRREPFTPTEHARAVAFAGVATELLPDQVRPDDDQHRPEAEDARPGAGDPWAHPEVRLAGPDDTAALMRMHLRCSADSIDRRYASPLARTDDRFARRMLLAGGGALVATVGHEVVAVASMSTCQSGVVEVALLVEDGWQRRGLGTRLLSQAARHARGQGAGEVVLRSRTHNPALMSLAFASGLRAQIRRHGDTVVVTVGVESLKPLGAPPERTGDERVATARSQPRG